MCMKQAAENKGMGNLPQEQFLQFEKYLEDKGASPRTITSYKTAVRLYFSLYGELTPENLISFKNYLINRYKSSTVNLRRGKRTFRLSDPFCKTAAKNFFGAGDIPKGL